MMIYNISQSQRRFLNSIQILHQIWFPLCKTLTQSTTPCVAAASGYGLTFTPSVFHVSPEPLLTFARRNLGSFSIPLENISRGPPYSLAYTPSNSMCPPFASRAARSPFRAANPCYMRFTSPSDFVLIKPQVWVQLVPKAIPIVPAFKQNHFETQAAEDEHKKLLLKAIP